MRGRLGDRSLGVSTFSALNRGRTTSSERYEFLDGLRGVAAISVIIYHFALFSGLPLAVHGYLAVDFFFVLSGFIIGRTYDKPLMDGSLTFLQFARRRVIRLYPMVIAGVLLGTALLPFMFAPTAPYNSGPVLKAVLSGLILLIPVHSSISSDQFPIDSPLWSLSTELWANFAFALLARRLGTRLLTVVICIAMAIFLGASLQFGTFRVGSQQGFYPYALVRTCASFGVGVLISRYSLERRMPVFGAEMAVLLAVLLGAVLLIVPTIPHFNRFFDLAAIVALLPAIVIIGVSTRMKGGAVLVSRLLGELSYPLYIFHGPFVRMAGLYAKSHALTWPALIALGFATVATSTLLSWAAIKPDEKLRAWLIRSGPRPVAATAP